MGEGHHDAELQLCRLPSCTMCAVVRGIKAPVIVRTLTTCPNRRTCRDVSSSPRSISTPSASKLEIPANGYSSEANG